MKNHIKHHPWEIIEDGFNTEFNRVSESLFSIGNGKFGQRGNFEETFTGDSLVGNYVAGVYYPDKTRVGWWKNGYPEYFAKVLNAPNWTKLSIKINGEILDLSHTKITEFRRILDMKNGVFKRNFSAKLKNGISVTVQASRFCSLDQDNMAAMSYSFSVDQSAEIEVSSYIDGNIKNEDANYDEFFWENIKSESNENQCTLIARTKKTHFYVGLKTETSLFVNNDKLNRFKSQKYSANSPTVSLFFSIEHDQPIVIEKKVIILSSLDVDKDQIDHVLVDEISNIQNLSYSDLIKNQQKAWAKKWDESDIIIEGDIAAQQAIRFNIFHLNCTYSGNDERLNIGPKGFTGEKYGGSTYWDTEAYCLPFYQSTADKSIARNLLIYRYNHLTKAIENAEKLGFSDGAALYPMVTMNGEECHNEWEITFEEIHRNGAIAYAIFDYINYTSDKKYLAEYGLEVLIGISRFWKQRVNWSEEKQAYVILGVTGPNEFENNVNNNWYTNKMATWCMNYCDESIDWVKIHFPSDFKRICEASSFNDSERKDWREISTQMYYPFSEKHNVYLQQDGFLDKELIPVSQLNDDERPIVEHWSWDKILRSCYIKQADILQGFYYFENEFTREELKMHYNFYEPLTVHESSLSPCIHSILAAKLGDEKRAYDFYLRTARLDLNDYNNDTRDGLHITSMAGTWMTVIKGFAGMEVKNDQLIFSPLLPKNWESLSFKINFRDQVKHVFIDRSVTKINE
ncbi:MAG: family 65 glycosyl hydrolase domain-containing protein [Bacteroidia bacterium]|nr:family 65 glycosyl hydrolase domain-containing protein [Bacteroidia bacterium]